VAADEPADETEESPVRSQLWADVRIDPIEIALPGGVGFTLRAYRPSEELPAYHADRDSDDHLDAFDAASAAVARARRSEDADEESDDAFDEVEAEELLTDEEDELEEEAEEEEADEETEDVPVFLGRNGRLYLFHSADKLVEYVRSGADNDLSHLDTWSDLVDRISADDVSPLDDDTYELDLLVENLRGGADAWDPTLIIRAGEIARDLGHALRIDPVQVALAPGSPLDDLDEALRAAADGGIGGFFAKRKLRKVSQQQSTLAWRTVIGKISAAADWRD
jgi:hypothetical protein